MSNHEDEYKILMLIAFISGSMCIIITLLGILFYECGSPFLPCRHSKIKNIYTMHNVILEDDAL